ncbi:Uncharacterised protein [Yersinia enterocolitica]|uniref:Tail fiber protein n=1 Tax=Yersinia enterocolitica TaxID=630 RepID=A0A9P1PX94_YEREN|nr:hypothetical protein [Yersinia enterocolitica]CNG09233.1 Uncharacterised protein [Yersinia enterocolitica]
MSKIERYAGNLRAFGSNAQGLERTLFGETTQADDLTSQVTSSFLRGWGIVGPSENPSMEDFNAAMYTMSQFIAYQHQMGIPEWDALQEYYSGSICVRNGEAYLSLVDSNIGSAPPSAKWTSVLTAKNALANISGFLKSANNLSEIAAAGSVAQAAAQANIGLTASKFSGRLLNTQTFTSTGTYTPTTGTAYIEVEAVGGGGASGSLSATGAGQGGITVPGSNGAYAFASFTTGFSSGVSVVIGSGGVGIFGNGPAGGSTAFGTLLSCPGGPGSFVSLAITPPGYTSPQPGPAIPTVTGGTLIKSGYGSLLNPAVILAPGVFTNYRLTTQTPIGTFGLGAGGQISNASAVALIGASGSSGYLIVREYS